MSLLFEPAVVGPLTLRNHMVMAPLTRNRAVGNLPNDLMTRYYGQRATVGLIISEGGSWRGDGIAQILPTRRNSPSPPRPSP